ncbi:hypothetical protein U2S91_09445 [Stenotrophomonas maltophilia]|nr:hypothetical protein U2S91_09445 [Stenotrophomonas maltophilia]
MTTLLIRYASTLNMRYDARDAGNFELEEQLLDQLDVLWLEMSEAERDACDEVARFTKQRHRMKNNFVSTHLQYRHFSGNEVLRENGGAVWVSVGFVHAGLNADASESRAAVGALMGSTSSSSDYFEPHLAYG